MKIALLTVQTPFVHGGGDMLAQGLTAALQAHGHQVDTIAMPFGFFPAAQVRRSMERWQVEKPDDYHHYDVDLTICLKFPAYYAQHPNKVLWLLHQFRDAYDLWNEDRASDDDRDLRRDIFAADTPALAAIPRRFTIARTVSDRLRRYNGLDSTPLYHPPPMAEMIYGAEGEMYIWCPSRLEGLKRQSLLIEAMQYVRSPVVALLAGDGGQRHVYELLIEEKGVGDKVKLLGAIDRKTMLAGYAMSLGVFFGPYDEDYGYVTLEAMLAGKPVITCADSGGPTEFVVDNETGFIVQPEPKAIAEAIDRLASDRARASAIGQAGRETYLAMNIGWDAVVEQLVGG